VDCIGNQRQTSGWNATDDLHARQQDIDRNRPAYLGITGFGVNMLMVSRRFVPPLAYVSSG
jgi:hypothetical protein